MLEFLKVKNPNQIKNLLQKFDPLQETWIVSDLKSKQEIQNDAIEKYSYYSDEAILRISDFWKLWIRRIEPTLNVVTSDFIKSLVQHFVDEYGSKLEIIDSEVSTLNKAIQEFAPILLHPSSDEVLEEWLITQQPEKKWRRWYQLAKFCINFIVYEKNVIDSKWCAAYLQTLDLKFLTWQRKLYIDLGSELSSVEMGLLKYISQKQDVIIISPDPIWKEKFPYILNTYDENFGYGGLLSSLKSEVSFGDESFIPNKNQFVKLSTQLAEVKFAVGRIRQWVDEGVVLNEIAIVSADIEAYWPVLQYYLEEEGIAYKKDLVVQLSGLGEVQNLLAAIKNVSSEVSWDSLEKNIFSDTTDFESSKQNILGIKFEKFKSLFYQLYDEHDLFRDQKIQNLYYKKIDFNSEIMRDDFLSYLVKSWMDLPHLAKQGIHPNQNVNQVNDLFSIIFRDFLIESLDIKIKFSRWVAFLKNRMSHKEVIVKKNNDNGISILPLMSAQINDSRYRIYIGLNDEYYHKKQNSLMSLTDSNTLKSEFDLAVDYSEESYLDFNLRWQSLACNETTIYTSAHISFAAEPLNASAFFIENSPEAEIIAPVTTRLDELQKQLATIEMPAQINEFNHLISAERLLQDLNSIPKNTEFKNINSKTFHQLSVSDSETYAQCSFKLLASKGFRLRDLPQTAIDLDPRQKGSLVHALFEFCINLIKKNEYSLTALSLFLDQKRIEFNLFQHLDAHWNIQKNKFLQLAEKFYQFEVNRIKNFDIETEKSIEIYFDRLTKKFTKIKSEQNPENYFIFKMRIDRVDTHKLKEYSVVYDYKSSAYQVSNYNKWLSDLQFQMLLYMRAMELEIKSTTQVKGAIYYQYKTFDLKKGLIEENVALADFALSKRNKCLIDEDAQIAILSEFNEKLANLLEQLNLKIFKAEPADIDLCKECDWRKLCRAPHLM